MRTITLTLSLMAALALSACKKDEPAAPAATPAPAATAPATPAPAPAPAETAPAPAGDAIGIAECDDYLTKYEACLADKVPEAARAALQQSLTATRDGWRQAAATEAGKDALKAACVSARDMARTSLQAYGCTDL